MDERVMDINLHNENHVYNENNTYNVNKTCNEQGDYNFQKIIGATLIYAIFFTFCIYKNFAGITAPFLAAATVGYAIFCLKEYKINIKKDSIFYKKMLTIHDQVCYSKSCLVEERYGGVAQLARACGSYPQCQEFKSLRRHQIYK